MRQLVAVFFLSVLTALILYPVTCTVNTPSNNHVLTADGVPPPPFPPLEQTMTAAGMKTPGGSLTS